MKTSLCAICCFFLFSVVTFAQLNQTDSISITTYYPSPYGVYRNLRLFPSQQPSAANAQPGTMYFNVTTNMTYVYVNATSKWQPVGGGAGDTYWQLNGTVLMPSNTAGVSDVCLGAGVCLSQLKSIAGNQTLLSNMHTFDSCAAAGGTVVPSDVSYPICRFNLAVCPGGWTQYKSFTSTSAVTCPAQCGTCCSCTSQCCGHCPPCGIQTCFACTTGSHAFGNVAVETCGASAAGWCSVYTCTANTIAVGCY